MEVAAWSPTSGQRQVSTATSNHAAAAQPVQLVRLTKTVAGIPPRSTASVRASRVGIDVARAVSRGLCVHADLGRELLGVRRRFEDRNVLEVLRVEPDFLTQTNAGRMVMMGMAAQHRP